MEKRYERKEKWGEERKKWRSKKKNRKRLFDVNELVSCVGTVSDDEILFVRKHKQFRVSFRLVGKRVIKDRGAGLHERFESLSGVQASSR